MQPLGAAVLILAVANIHWGSTELTPALANPTPTVGKAATQANQDIETTKSQQSATKPVIGSPTPGSTEKSTTVFSNTTSVPDSNSTLPLGPGSSSTTSTSGTHPGPTTFGIQTEPTTMFIDYSKPTQPVQDDSDLSSGPTPSAFEKTRFIAPAVMVPILLVGAVSFIVWKMCQSDPPGSDQNENPKYVSKTGSVQLLSVRTTTPQTDVK